MNYPIMMVRNFDIFPDSWPRVICKKVIFLTILIREFGHDLAEQIRSYECLESDGPKVKGFLLKKSRFVRTLSVDIKPYETS